MSLQLMAAAAANFSTQSIDITGMMDTFLIVAFIGYGIYAIYSCVAQHASTYVLENKIICPSGCDPKKCRDAKAFLQFMLPKTLILGVALLALGGLLLVDHLLMKSEVWMTLLLIALPLAVCAWYVREQNKAVHLFWNGKREPGWRR